MSSRVRSLVVLAGLLTLIATAVLRFGTATSVAAVSSTLHANVGPGFDISLTFDDGTAVGALPAGTYRVVVSDSRPTTTSTCSARASTSRRASTTRARRRWNVTFRANSRYQFLCDPHADSMFGRFDVGTVVGSDALRRRWRRRRRRRRQRQAAARRRRRRPGRSWRRCSPESTRPGSSSSPCKGKPVKTLAAGSYKIVVTDSSKKNDVTLRRIGRRGDRR